MGCARRRVTSEPLRVQQVWPWVRSSSGHSALLARCVVRLRSVGVTPEASLEAREDGQRGSLLVIATGENRSGPASRRCERAAGH